MTAPATDSLSGIVGRLTKGQRAMLVGAHEGAIGDGWFVFMRNGRSTKIIGNLCAKGLCEPHRINIQRLTPLGIAIRQHMEKES